MQPLIQLYLTQLKQSLMNTLNRQVPESLINPNSMEEQLQTAWFDHFWFGDALTMCSLKRLDNIQWCIEQCLADQVPGDCIECGIWRGGAVMLMRGVLAAYGVTNRTVWVADSFQGLPTPPANSVDEGMYHFPQVVELDHFRVNVASVQANFTRYGLLDHQVRFLPGWFRDTLPQAPIDRLAILRLDGDYYESTRDTLRFLYAKLAPGGFVIIDDWGIDQICGAKAAVVEFRRDCHITDDIIPIDWHSAYWRKSS
jgi:O-methyltransferase